MGVDLLIKDSTIPTGRSEAPSLLALDDQLARIIELVSPESLHELLDETVNTDKATSSDEDISIDDSAETILEEKITLDDDQDSIDDEVDSVDDDDIGDYKLGDVPFASYELDPASAQAFYQQSSVDYDKLYADMGVGKQLTGHDVEYSEGIFTTEHSAEVHSQKASKMVAAIQRSVLLRSSEKVSAKDRQAFAYWQTFNKSLLMLYHATSAVVHSDVDYGTIMTNLQA